MAKADDAYGVRLRLVRHDGAPAAGLRVRGFDQDRGRSPDPLGETVTDSDGQAALSFLGAAAGGPAEGAPEFFVIVDGDAGLLHQSRPVSLQPGDHDLGNIRLPLPPGGMPAATTPGLVGTSPAPAPNDPAATPGDNRIHGSAGRGAIVPRSSFHHGPFGRLFRKLPPWTPPGADDATREAAIRSIADVMVEAPGSPDAPSGDNDAMPVGYTYFGQFVDHDITFDPTSSLVRLNDPDRLSNFRTPRFDLDNLYGEGPDDEPFLYDQRPDHAGEFLLGRGPSPVEADLPRNEQGTALIGDPRNDENIIVAQLQLAFLQLHNRVLARVRAEEGLIGREAFVRAQTLTRWHYQWVVLRDFLPRICGADAVDRALVPLDGTGGLAAKLRFYSFKDAPFMPVEFSAAAYRYGHSQVRERYDLNSVVRGVPIFLPPSQNPGELADLRGFRRLPGMWTLDWRLFLPMEDTLAPQASRRIDTRLSRALASIPAGPDPRRGASLAFLNLMRGFRLGLPSGQAVARAMGVEPLDAATLGLDAAAAGQEAPLWYYVLREADVAAEGRHLGPVGATIVAETFVGLAAADPNGFLAAEPGWRPSTAFRNGPPLDPAGDDLQLSGLLRASGAGRDPFRP